MIMQTPLSRKQNIKDLLPQTDHFIPVFKRNLPLSPDPNVDVEMLDDQFSKNESILFNILELEKYISNDSDIKEFNSNINDNGKSIYY